MPAIQPHSHAPARPTHRAQCAASQVLHPTASHCLPLPSSAYYGGASGFELVLDLLDDACEGLLDRVNTSKQQ